MRPAGVFSIIQLSNSRRRNSSVLTSSLKLYLRSPKSETCLLWYLLKWELAWKEKFSIMMQKELLFSDLHISDMSGKGRDALY